MALIITLALLTLTTFASAIFYYRRTKRLLNKNREIMEHSVEDAFLRVENRLVHGITEFKKMPNGKKVWMIVFTYDRKELLQKAISSLKVYEPTVPVLVVDNGSADGSRELLLELLHKSVINKVLLNTHRDVPQWQKSFALNQALKLLTLETPDYIAWMDDDVTVGRPFVADAIDLLEKLRSESVRVISMTDDEVEERNHPTLKRLLTDLPSGKTEIKIRATFNGQFNLFSCDFFRELGPPPIGEGIRNFAGEDWYYSRRLQSLDYRAAVMVAAKHAGAITSKREEIERQTLR